MTFQYNIIMGISIDYSLSHTLNLACKLLVFSPATAALFPLIISGRFFALLHCISNGYVLILLDIQHGIFFTRPALSFSAMK